MAFAKFKIKNQISVSSGSSGETSIIPVGLIIPWTSSTPPDGWLLCDGSSVNGTIYPSLFSLIGSSLPDLSGSVVVGSGTGSGNGSSGIGNSPTSIISGTALTSRTNNTLAVPTSSKPAVSATHSHPVSSHDHPMPHTHSYPHTHSGADHSHDTTHSHSINPDGGHTHQGRFSNQYTTGAGSSVRTSGPQIPAADPEGGHTHSIGASAWGSIGASSSGFNNPVATGSFTASGTTETGTTSTVSQSFGGSTSFDVTQPSMTVYYIIKY